MDVLALKKQSQKLYKEGYVEITTKGVTLHHYAYKNSIKLFKGNK